MEALRQRILEEGQNLGRGILKIDSFLNHQVDAGNRTKVCRLQGNAGVDGRSERDHTGDHGGKSYGQFAGALCA